MEGRAIGTSVVGMELPNTFPLGPESILHHRVCLGHHPLYTKDGGVDESALPRDLGGAKQMRIIGFDPKALAPVALYITRLVVGYPTMSARAVFSHPIFVHHNGGCGVQHNVSQIIIEAMEDDRSST
jgi:hypothetical protein